jgi:hypothetical protein
MRYKYLYDRLTFDKPKVFLRDGPPNGNTVYTLDNIERRASATTLELTNDHEIQSPSIHLVNSSILISVGFKCLEYSESTLYVCWIENAPENIILWERHKTLGITFCLEEKRFNSQQQKSVSKATSPGRSDFQESFSSSLNSQGFYPGDFLLKEAESSTKRFIYLDQFISEKLKNSRPLFDDDEFDPSGSISKLRIVFEHAREVGSAMIAASLLPWLNMNKTILNVFKAEWEYAIYRTRNDEIDGLILESVWLQIMWFHVIGCPACVHTIGDFISLVRDCVATSRNWSEAEIIIHLQGVGISESLSRWIIDHRLSSTFEEDIRRLSKPVSSWNSYLCVYDNLVYYTHLHITSPPNITDNSSESTDVDTTAEPIAPQQLILSVAEEDSSGCKKTITPIQIEMDKMRWFPVDFARSAFNRMKNILQNSEGCYILGHCCAEQAIVNMGKSGLTPYKTHTNDNSCGHGMYFFRLDFDITDYAFDDLNNNASQSQPFLQFRAFIYALNRVFIRGTIDALSSSVLLFVVPVDKVEISPHDAVNGRLPICNDSESITGGWNCACPRATNQFDYISTDKFVNNGKVVTKAIDVCDMINKIPNGMITVNESERVNAFALTLGVVDYNRIKTGVYKAIIADSNMQTFNVDKLFKEQGSFDKWKKTLLSRSYYRRPIIYFDRTGMFTSEKKLYLPVEKGQPHWGKPPEGDDDDPIEETVFVTQASIGIYAIFLSPFSEYSQRSSPECHAISDDDCLSTEVLLDSSTHNYWKLRSRCKMNHPTTLNDEM